MAFLFLGLGVQLPFLPLWLADRGLSTAEIAIVLSGQILIRTLGAPLGTFLADRYKRPVPLIRFLPLLCAASYFALSFMHGFGPIFLVAVLAAITLSPVSPLAENFAMVESAKAGLDYGRQRSWASISFIVGTLVSGFALEVMTTSTAVVLIAISYAALGLAGFVLPDVKPRIAHGQRQRARAGDVLRLFRSRVFVIFLLAVSMAQASHAMLYGFGSLHWEQLGISKATIGVLWGTGVCAEVVFFYCSGRLLPHFAPILLIFIGCLSGVLRWTATAFDPALWLLFPLQTLHATTFALTHFGTLHFLMQNVPDGLRNSAQGLYAACSAGLFLMLATAAAGPLFDAFAGRAYLAMTVMSLVASALALIVLSINPKGQGAAAASRSPQS
jgi:PPP family 3-phenylpropionic acid transporter